jgi:hypothetical protein
MLNKYLKVENFILLILLFLAVNAFIPFGNTGMSQDEHEYKLQIHDLKQEKQELLNEIDTLETHIISFENEILKNDSIIDNADINQLDSMFTAYFNR